MTTENIALFKALGAKMDYLSHRQRVIAENVANADTPGYKPMDLTKVDFGSVLKKITGNNAVTLEKTSAAHMAPGGSVDSAKEKDQKTFYEVAPVGNAVIMEEQMVNAGQTVMDYNLMTNLYTKNVRMIQIAIGAGG
ncbi:MAG: flagellar basal body rod protein FlgB [Alphaproteobacteria bacterium]|nr:flagellar basal body rod protein FlgB [Alphaproteobacteria bacterium]